MSNKTKGAAATKKCPTTLEEIKALKKEVLIPADIFGYLKCDPYYINLQARTDPRMLGYNVTVTGSRVRIPKEAFIAWAEGVNVDAIIAAIEKQQVRGVGGGYKRKRRHLRGKKHLRTICTEG